MKSLRPAERPRDSAKAEVRLSQLLISAPRVGCQIADLAVSARRTAGE
jgi:hypothetical protein